MTANPAPSHEESWLMLPWLVNGRLSHGDRAWLEEHVRGCPTCERELALQRLLCRGLTEPDRVTYAPGPSFRKLMARIDGRAAAGRRAQQPAVGRGSFPSPALSAWRPPGLAWAASFLAVIALGVMSATAYRWSQPLYGTRSDFTHNAPGVLHIAFQRSLPIGAVEQLLRSSGARVVEGPDATGIFGVSPTVARDADERALRELALRLRGDARVRWVEPQYAAGAADGAQGQRPPEP